MFYYLCLPENVLFHPIAALLITASCCATYNCVILFHHQHTRLYCSTTTNCLMPSDQRISTMANITGSFFHHSTSLQPERCLFTIRNTYSAYIMELPLSSSVSHFPSLLQRRCWFAVAHKWLGILLLCNGNCPQFLHHTPTFILCGLVARTILCT